MKITRIAVFFALTIVHVNVIHCYPQKTLQGNSSSMILLPKEITKTNKQKILVHYMPWFEDTITSINGKWGQHWTMANKNPSVFLPDGKREIAAHYYPLIGPYASSDTNVLRYHMLLMKYAGIDGVIADWYGTQALHDYSQIKKNTDALFIQVESAGLQMAICYEDAALTKARAANGTGLIAAAQQDFAYLQQHYFQHGSYIKVNNSPLLLCFGPNILERPWFWQKAFSGLNEKPCLLTLWYKGANAGYMGMGEFPWIDANNIKSLQDFYRDRSRLYLRSIAGAYPGFRDYYQQGGWEKNLFIIDHNGTATLETTLELARESQLPFVQICTWNDFGEGTMIEPTLEFNFRFLETVQRYSGVPYTIAELRLIYQWYILCKKYKTNVLVQTQLLQSYYFLISLDIKKAGEIISHLR